MTDDQQADLGAMFRGLLRRSEEKNHSESTSVGTINGNNLIVDGIDVPIPLSDVVIMQHWQDSRAVWAKPSYSNGDRVLVLARTDSDFVVIGKVG